MKTLQELLDLRFGDIGAVPETLAGNEAIRRLAGRGVVRRFKPEPLPAAVLDTLAAVALSSPSKSDLQQRDILIVEDAAIRARINALLKDQDWIAGCPHLLVFLGNNMRQRQVHAWRGHTFANDHLDAFFNATVDAAIALEAFVAAAEAAGLGCCPISVIRNHAEEVSGLLSLPDHGPCASPWRLLLGSVACRAMSRTSTTSSSRCAHSATWSSGSTTAPVMSK